MLNSLNFRRNFMNFMNSTNSRHLFVSSARVGLTWFRIEDSKSNLAFEPRCLPNVSNHFGVNSRSFSCIWTMQTWPPLSTDVLHWLNCEIQPDQVTRTVPMDEDRFRKCFFNVFQCSPTFSNAYNAFDVLSLLKNSKFRNQFFCFI